MRYMCRGAVRHRNGRAVRSRPLSEAGTVRRYMFRQYSSNLEGIRLSPLPPPPPPGAQHNTDQPRPVHPSTPPLSGTTPPPCLSPPQVHNTTLTTLTSLDLSGLCPPLPLSVRQ